MPIPPFVPVTAMPHVEIEAYLRRQHEIGLWYSLELSEDELIRLKPTTLDYVLRPDSMGIPQTDVKRIVSWARRCGKSNLTLESEDDLHCYVDIENGVIDFDPTPTEPFTVNYEVNRMTPASMGAISTNEGMDERTIEKRYAALMGHKKPKYERTEADENALKAAHAKRRRKAMKRLKAAEKARETV